MVWLGFFGFGLFPWAASCLSSRDLVHVCVVNVYLGRCASEESFSQTPGSSPIA